MPAVHSDLQVTSYIQEFFERFQGIEARLALRSQKLGIAFELPSDGLATEVVKLARAGDRIGAVRRCRELTGADLGQARHPVSKP